MGWTAFRLVDLAMILYGQSERLHDRRSLSDMIVPTAANGVKLSVFLLAVSCQVYLIGSRDTLTQLLAGLGLIGLAASLAAQDTLKNFFGTLLLIGEHPFRIGEQISVQGSEGTVESVGFRSTRLRTADETLLTIPNSVMASAVIDNRATRTSRRFRTVVSLDYGAPIEKVIAMRDALKAFAAAQPRFEPDKIEIHIGALGANGVELAVQAYFRVTSSDEELECGDLMIREILEQSRRQGIDVAVGGRTVQLAGTGSEGHAVPPAPKLASRERLVSPRQGLVAEADGRGGRNS
jgi:MscS family membrane protein